MNHRRFFNRFPRRKSTAARQWLCAAVALITAEREARLLANPTGLLVGAGSASAQQSGSQLNVTVGSAALLNWSSFNIQAGETTTFIQPSANSVVLNEIGGHSPSQIFGSLNANGTVILANANGFYFGPNSMIKVGGSFIATTAPLPPDFGAGSAWQFTGMPPLAKIVNYGQIQAGAGRSLYLIAEDIENDGALNAPGGAVALYGGESVLVSDSPDGRALSANVTVPAGSVDNQGRITADAGTIALRAQVVNQNGLLQANSVKEENGVIELVASDSLTLGADSQISARGDDGTPGSSGGTVTLKSGNTFSDANGSAITTSGGAQGGNGGNIEVSAPEILSLNSSMDSSAQAGSLGGEFLLDPTSIVLGTSTSLTGTVPANGTVAYNSGAGTLSLDVNTAFQNKSFSQILLQATGDITLNQNTTWNLSTSTGETTGNLTLEAGGSIIFNTGAQIKDANDWSVTLAAGYSFSKNAVQPGIQAGSDSIFLGGATATGSKDANGQNLYTALTSGTGSILLAQGSVNLTAGQDVLVGKGYVNTTGGGAISATALTGNINAGTANAYGTTGYSVNPKNSGISTLAGGDVTLTAGNSIISTPTAGNGPAGSSGAYGAGDVTLTAGNLVEGNFQVSDGTGTILAGVTVANGQVTATLNPNASVGYAPPGNSAIPVNLSLISGSWNVWAANYVYLGEVRNPSGSLDANDSFPFNYAPNAALNLWAGNAITLNGTSSEPNGIAPVYPSKLSLNAGAGGITLNDSVILYPSSQGSLNITTRNGGSLTGNSTSVALTGITMSDGDPTDYTTFALGHGDTPLHADDPSPVVVNVTGNIDTFNLTVPTFAEITVGWSTYNFGFSGQNLSPSQTTSISVAGGISYRGDLTSVSLAAALPAELLDYNLSGLPELAEKLQYDSTTGTLTFVGVMTKAELAFLQNPTVVELDQYGNPVLDDNGNAVYVPVTLTSGQTVAINQLYTSTQSATLNDQGLGIAGPGHFDVTAASIDLGISGGIYADAPDAALASISPEGADINVTSAGNLSMTTSQIANAGYLGNINLTVGGTLDVGDNTTTVGDNSLPKGIFTESGGSISVLAQGDVDVNSSRIAAYDGGNVTVESVNGNVNAGNGGAGLVNVNGVELDPVTGELTQIPIVGIGGSGIVATTLPGSDATVGNILVESPRGSITASQGGILQISLNGTDASQATAALFAGYEVRNSLGEPITAADINNPSVQGSLVAAAPGEAADTVLVGGQRLTLSSGAYANLLSLLGVAPAAGQVVSMQVSADAPNFINALKNSGDGLSAYNFVTMVSPGENINASGSGVVAQNAAATATGEAQGLFVGFHSVNLNASQIGPGVAFGPTVNITDTGDAGGGSGPSITVIAQNPVDVNNAVSAPTAPATASVAKEVATVADNSTTVADNSDAAGDDLEAKKKQAGKPITLARRVSRVTVLLPGQ